MTAMITPADAVNAFNAGKAAILAKGIANADAEFDKASLKLKIADISTTVLELMDVNQQLRDEVKRLTDLSVLKGQVIFHINACWQRSDGKVLGPFCPHCWEAEQLLIHLPHSTNYYPTCPKCKYYADPPPVAPDRRSGNIGVRLIVITFVPCE